METKRNKTMNELYPLKIIEKKLLTNESVSIKLEIPTSLKKIFQFEPGQFVMIEKEIDGKKFRRYYSIYSTKNQPYISLGIKVKENDGFASFALNDLKTGDFLQVSPPGNDIPFKIEPDKKRKFLAVTIGSGITPFYSMIQSIINEETQSKIILLFGNHNTEKTMFYNELKELEKKYPNNLKIYWVFSQTNEGDFKGHIDQNIIEKLIKEEGTDFDAVYIIGPDDLKKKVAETLKNQGITDDKLHYRIYS